MGVQIVCERLCTLGVTNAVAKPYRGVCIGKSEFLQARQCRLAVDWPGFRLRCLDRRAGIAGAGRC